MDPNNPVVRLCVQGMEEESNGNHARAAELFEQAWKQGADDLERCIAAHYVARHQTNAELALHWNQEAMNCAQRITGDSVTGGFFASLHLNLGKSHEDLGNLDEALHQYESAAEKLASVPAGPYRDIVQGGIESGLRRATLRHPGSRAD
jgi:tetratricopeptide (TPR) repeat protein